MPQGTSTKPATNNQQPRTAGAFQRARLIGSNEPSQNARLLLAGMDKDGLPVCAATITEAAAEGDCKLG